jgi:hypothetical protein
MKGISNMSEILRFNIDAPVEVALAREDGVHVNGRYGEQVMYSLADQRVMYVPPYVERRIQELAIGPGEPVEICKAEVKSGSRRWIEWKVKRVDASQQPASSTKAPAAAANGVSKTANNHEHGTTGRNGHDRPRLVAVEPEPSVPLRLMPSGVPALEHALTTAIEIAQRVEGLAASRNYSLRFSSEDIRAMAVSMFIQLTRDGGVRWQQ